MKNLNRINLPNIKPRPLRIMQFGGGNFLRAFVNHIVQELNQETDFNAGVVIVKPTKRGDYQELREQDGLFSVQLEGLENGQFVQKLEIVDCVQNVIHPYTQWAAYLELAKNPEIRFIISNTTEAGIKFNAEDSLSDTPPHEFPAKLTLWLFERFKHFQGALDKGCILLPCELIEANGDTLKSVILQYADHWKIDTDFHKWVNESCTFYNTLVDRIVSGYPKDKIKTIELELGFEDQLAVSGELYLNWLIEGPEILKKEFPFEQTDLNIKLVEDLDPHRNLKVRVLNGAHTAMVPVGYLIGHRLVKEIMGDETATQFISDLLQEEVSTTVPFSKVEVDKFIADVLDRFRNPALEHQLLSIALNSSTKFCTRLLPTLKDYLIENSTLPKRIVLAFAALIRFYKGTDLEGRTIPLKDNQVILKAFSEAWTAFEEKPSYSALTKQILGDTTIWQEDLNQLNGLTELTATYLENMEQNGLPSLLVELLNNQPIKSDSL